VKKPSQPSKGNPKPKAGKPEKSRPNFPLMIQHFGGKTSRTRGDGVKVC